LHESVSSHHCEINILIHRCTMFKPTSVCYSALTKRTKKVRVQVLRDFPRFQLYKGQVTQVKPSLMRNYLHNFNGAKYIMEDTDINTILFERYSVQEQEREKEATALAAAHQAAMINAATNNSATSGNKPKLSQEMKNQEKKKITHNKDVTIKDVYIPGLDI